MKSTSKQDQEQDALSLFNEIKDTYQIKIEDLNDLKREVSRTDQIDQQQKSKLRITIESLLIDLNEEIFTISEELAKSYTFERQKNILQKARDFDQRKKILLKKIRDSIDENSSVKTVRRSMRIHNASPPQKESPQHIQSTKHSLRRNHTFNEVYTSDHSSKESRGNSIGSAPRDFPKAIKQQRSTKKQKSPVPLRRKDDSSSVDKRSNSRNKQRQSSAKKKLFSYEELPKSNRSKGGKIRNSKKLDEFEKYLAAKSGKENYQPPERDNQPALQQYSTMLQSEAFEAFAQDFAHMKNKMLQLQQRVDLSEDKTKSLENEVEKLKTENVKLTTDVKIIRSEHSEILHSLYSLEKKNTTLQSENQVLKRIVQGERDVRGQESNLPKPYIEPMNDVSIQEIQVRQTRSPFSSIMQKNRSSSHLRESKDEVLMGTQQFHNPTEYKSKYDLQPEDRQSYNQVRSSHKQWPHQNALLSNSQERQVSQSFNHGIQQPPLYQTGSRIVSGANSRREEVHQARINDTPTTYHHATDETPTQYRHEGRPRSFIQNKKQYGGDQSVVENTNTNLSDWVLERINKNK